MATIACFEVEKWETTYLKKKLKGHKLLFFDEPVHDANADLAKTADVVSVFIYSQLSKKNLAKMPKVKCVATRSTGFDHIDLNYCKHKKITVSNVPFYGENTVAEHTFGLILSLSRHIHKSYVRTLREDFRMDGLMGFDLKDKTIGIIGGGHIGMHVARIARAFGMHVRVYDIYKNDFLADVINYKYLGLDEMLKVSDIVSLHVPYNAHTHHLINRKNIMKMKKSSILINTARGAIVDTDALHDALKSKHLWGAGLDVIEGEELIKEDPEQLNDDGSQKIWKTMVRNHAIFKMDNVVFTPHNAFNSKEAFMRILDTSVENIRAFMEKSPQNTLV